MNYNEFEVITYIERNNGKKIKNSDIEKNTGITEKEVKESVELLISNRLIEYSKDGEVYVTQKGYEELEPYRVKKGIILAAGKGTRLLPLTKETPKPMVKVNDKRIIETQLDALKAAGIEDVTIVRGYLSEKFDELLEKYPYIKFVDNIDYDKTNNMSSAYLVRKEMKNAYIFEADLNINNSNLIRKYEYKSNYLGKYVEHTDDWCYETNGTKITDVKKGGNNCYHMYGISYFNEESGKRFETDVEKVYLELEGGKDRFYDDVNLSIYNENYDFYVRECKAKDIIEIDTLEELKQIDAKYAVQFGDTFKK